MYIVIVANAPDLDAAPYLAQIRTADVLIAADGGALPLLRLGLLPQLVIGDLDSPRYVVRETAMKDLEKLGAAARDAVRGTLAKATLSPEMRERLEKLADKTNKPDTGTEFLRHLRAVEDVEQRVVFVQQQLDANAESFALQIGQVPNLLDR